MNNVGVEEIPVQVKQFRVLIMGNPSEVAGVIQKLKSKNESVYADYLQLGKDEGVTVSTLSGVHHIHTGFDDALISSYDLILMNTSHSGPGKEILNVASRHGVLVSVIEAEASGTAKFNRAIRQEKYWRKIAFWCLCILALVIIGQVITSYYPIETIYAAGIGIVKDLNLDSGFVYMLAAGFFAQMVDGALGMGYGVISTTILLSTGLNPAAISGSIHTAEMFSSGASGFSHYRFGNINKKLFKTLLLPGVAGAVIGALLLCYLGEAYGSWMRPVLSVYTLLLGARILRNAFAKRNDNRKVKRAGWLAGAGGFLDSFGGGGWGPLVTSTLISKGKTPRYIIGTVSLTEFFVTLGSALTFFLVLGTSHIETIAGLIIGGLLAAPIAARLAGNLKTKTILIGVGVLVILSSLRTILKTVGGI